MRATTPALDSRVLLQSRANALALPLCSINDEGCCGGWDTLQYATQFSSGDPGTSDTRPVVLAAACAELFLGLLLHDVNLPYLPYCHQRAEPLQQVKLCY